MEVLGLIDVPVWFLTTLVVLVLSVWYNYGFYTHFQKYGIEGPTPLPFVGNLISALRTGFLKNEIILYQKYKHKRCYGSYLLGSTPTLTITDIDVMKEVLVKQFNKFANRRILTKNPAPLNKMLTTLVDDHWKHVRSMTTPAFTTGRLKNMTGLIKKAGEQLAVNIEEKCEKNEEVDIRAMCGCFTMDVIASTMFGIAVDSQKDPNDEFVKHANEIFKFSLGNAKVLIAIMFPKLSEFLKKLGIELFNFETFNFFTQVTNQAMKQRQETPGQFHDFLDIMIKDEVSTDQVDRKTHYPTGETMEWSSKGILREEILAQAVIFFLAGFDTTANTLHYLCYHLAMDQDVQNKVIEELTEAIGDSDITYENVNKLEYLDMCIQEALRMYPPAFRFDRTCSEDVVIDGITITKGTSVGFPAYAIHFDPEIYPDPTEFNPMRYTDEEKAKRNPYHWMPFGMGPRNCPGMRLALLEMKIAAAAIMKKCKFARTPSTPAHEDLEYQMGTVRPKKPIMLKVELRD
ncbi:cytochrome P450 3A24-like [Lineus longissimus]|uniref:cytochrome P450 3A24-like n=1 Tax=Lineus longissimus TaxID=88925 RepID=UPI002B4EFED8